MERGWGPVALGVCTWVCVCVVRTCVNEARAFLGGTEACIPLHSPCIAPHCCCSPPPPPLHLQAGAHCQLQRLQHLHWCGVNAAAHSALRAAAADSSSGAGGGAVLPLLLPAPGHTQAAGNTGRLQVGVCSTGLQGWGFLQLVFLFGRAGGREGGPVPYSLNYLAPCLTVACCCWQTRRPQPSLC